MLQADGKLGVNPRLCTLSTACKSVCVYLLMVPLQCAPLLALMTTRPSPTLPGTAWQLSLALVPGV